MLSVTSLLFASSLNTLTQTNTLPQPSGKTSQVNQLSLAQSTSLDSIQSWLNSSQFSDLRSVTATSNLDIGEYQLSITFEFDLKNPTQTKTNYTKSRQAMMDNFTKAKNEPVLTERKFDRNKLVESFSKPIDSSKPMIPTEEELQYYEINGVLPPIQVNEQELRAKAKELNISVIPHLDKTLKGKFTNARIEDRLASMTPEDKQQNDQRVQEAKTQNDLLQYLKVGISGDGTQNGSESRSRDPWYKATYNPFNGQVCFSYSAKLWNA